MPEYYCRQETVHLKAMRRGEYLVTGEVEAQLVEVLRPVRAGTVHLFLLHTDCGLSVNENADPQVALGVQQVLHGLVPDSREYPHQNEGPGDFPGHALCSLVGCQLTLPVTDGRIVLGTWQGLHFHEFRQFGGERQIYATVQGVVG